MSESQPFAIIESMLAQQQAAFGQNGLDAAVKRLESAAKLTGICMHTASDILCYELEMMTKGSQHLASVTESLLADTDIEHAGQNPAETVKLAVEETIEELRHLNDMMRASTFEIYDAFIRTLLPATNGKDRPKAAPRPTEKLSAAA